MATAREVAVEVLPHFAEAVIARREYTYGHYAVAIGRSEAKESIVIGQAMHAIGAACVFCAVPVAPLAFVKRADGEWRGVFETDILERQHVLPHFDLLYVTARDFEYSSRDFERVGKALADVLPRHVGPNWLSPHELWTLAVTLKASDGRTVFERAVAKYESLYSEAKARRKETK
jgi:hypothetical protein